MKALSNCPGVCAVRQSGVAAPATATCGTHAVRPVVRTSATSGSVSNGPDPAPEAVHDGRLSLYKTFFEQYTKPIQYVEEVLAGHQYAWGRTGLPGKDTLFIADADAVRSILAAELQLGVGSDWPESFRGMLGTSSLSMTTDQQLHARLRQYLGMAFTKDAVQQMLPELQGVVAGHMARWAAATTPDSSANSSSSGSSGSSSSGNNSSNSSSALVGLVTTPDGSMLLGYPAVRMLTFDTLVNSVLGLRMSQEEVCQSAVLFQLLVDGFMPPAWDLPFTAYGKGLKARQQLTARIQQTLSSPDCSGPLARLRDEFGADSPVAIDNTITMLFAGFDTTSSSITYMLWLLAQHPEVFEKIRAEQAAIVPQYGPTFTPEAYAAMTYTMATVKEALRAAQIIGFVPRVATKELQVPGGPALPAGCPFLVALAAISKADPALAATGDGHLFKPERWLEPGAAKALSQHQLPFGTGQRTCLGMNLANAEMVAVLAELGRSYTLAADVNTDWQDFPIKKPLTGLPIRLLPRQPGANAGAAAAAAAAAATAAAGSATV